MALRFDAQADALQRSANLPSSTNFTLCGWFRRRGEGGTNELLCAIIDASTSVISCYIKPSGVIEFHVYATGGVPTSSGVAVATDQWYFVALSNAGTGATDAKVRHAAPGATAFTTASTTGISITPVVLTFGYNDASQWPNVALAGWKLYDRVLTDAELLAEMNQLTPASTTNLNAWWPMVANAATTADNDYSGNARDLTPGGTLTVEDGPPVGWGAPVLVVGQAGGATYDVALTGVESTAAIGTVTVERSAVLAGNEVETAAGTLTPDLATLVELTGVESGTAVGTLAVVQVVGLSGAESTAATGTITGATAVALTGIEVETDAGTLTPDLAQLVALTGVEATATAGGVAVAQTVALAGAEVSVAAGTLTPELATIVALTGNEATSAAGTVAPGATAELAGNEVATTLGTITPLSDGAVGLSGHAVTTAVGTLAVESTAAISGAEVATAAGTLGVVVGEDVAVELVGAEATIAVGSFGPSLSAALTGAESTTDVGVPGGYVDLGLTGIEVQGLVGQLFVGERLAVDMPHTRRVGPRVMSFGSARIGPRRMQFGVRRIGPRTIKGD